MPNATVILTNTDTNISQTSTSSPSGQYYFNRLPPGPYRVTVEAKGFAKTVRDAQLTTEQTAGIDIQVAINGTNDTVTVSAEDSHGLNLDETRLQYTLSAREIEEFPLQNRSTLSLLRSAPGATGIDEGQVNIPVNRTTSGESANGRSNAGNLYLLDFIPVNSQIGGFTQTDTNGAGPGAVTIVPHPDMVQEIALQTTTFSVENGTSSGIQTSITTKSGANKFHGDADYTYTGTPFAAVAPFGVKTPFRKQFVSGALGGPIWKDRTFFFGSYFNQQVGTPNAGFQTYYSNDFIAWGLAHYPNSQNIAKGLAPFPADRAISNAQVTLRGSDVDSSCDPSGTSATVIPCSLAINQQSPFATPQTDNGAQYNFRLDHTLRSGKDRLYASFFRFDQNSVSARIQSTYDGQTPSTGYYIAGNYTHEFSSSLLNQASFGQTRFAFNYAPTAHSTVLLTVPYVNGCGGCGGGNVSQFLETQAEHQTYGRDTVSYVKGRHNMTFGFQGSYNNEFADQSALYGRVFLQLSFGIYNFLDDVTNGQQIYTLSAQNGKFLPQLFGAQGSRFGLYAQDAWKITPHLLLTYGLRWDDYGNPASYGKNAEPYANVVLGSGSSLQQQVANASSVSVSNVYASSRNKNFLPRASVAYTLPGTNNNTLLHAGAGLYSDDLTLTLVANNLPTQPPTRLSISQFGITTPSLYGNSTVQGPPGGNPYGFVLPTVPVFGFSKKGAPLDANGNPQPYGLNGTDPNVKPQKAVLYNIGIEQQMPAKLVFGLLYSGSYGYDQIVQTDVNTYPGLTADPANQRYNTDFAQIKFFRNAGISNYNALIATARQTIGKLTYQASYTWGKSLGDPNVSFTDQYNIHSQYSNLNGDIRNRFSLSQVYEVPAKFHQTALNEVLSGWSINNSIIAQSGSPFSIATTSGAHDYNQDGVQYDLPVYSGTKRSFSRSDERRAGYSQTSVFAGGAADFSTPSGLGEGQGNKQNTFRGPGYFTLDTGLSKNFQIKWWGAEHSTFTLRGEALNILNYANYGNPDPSFDDSTLGYVQTAHQGRIIQLGGRFQF
ncbi:outer membrane receptor protein involved in Fe transport [Edaphobacter lichenicola]|uniref:Outer membrane receptor protein involved in Fe transport n=1 Tax=Tunturiibacter lichenicola TaxID=2051959 RepID=A0A852VEX0_9BACT|nr:outer membrane receptor protein involved in Fe transport [Edaphobacter lichenicola]